MYTYVKHMEKRRGSCSRVGAEESGRGTEEPVGGKKGGWSRNASLSIEDLLLSHVMRQRCWDWFFIIDKETCSTQ